MNRQSRKSHTDEYIRNFIRELIFITPPGGRLPGVRQLMKESGVGRIRLETILHEFESAGTIAVRAQSGRYRPAAPPPPSPMVFIHFSRQPIMENDNSFPGGAVKMLRQKALANNTSLEILQASALNAEQLCAILQKYRTKQVFIWGADNVELLHKIKTVAPCTVSILPRHPAAEISELRDSPDMSRIQLEYLFCRKYRNIAYIHNAEDWQKSPVQMQRLLDYYRIMAEHGIKIEPEWVFYCAYDKERFNRSMHRLWNSSRRVQAVIVPGSSLKRLYDFCANNGIKIGSELAVMCSDDIKLDLHPRATVVTNSPREIGLAAWELMQETVQNKISRKFTNLKIITGETVPSITTQKNPEII